MNRSDVDPHGQPYSLHFNAATRTERDLAEMLGIAKGILADGVVTDDEAHFLRLWAANHPNVADSAIVRAANLARVSASHDLAR